LKNLRHFNATQLLAAGVDLRTTAGRLGHSDGGATTLRVYASRTRRVAQKAAELLAADLDALRKKNAAADEVAFPSALPTTATSTGSASRHRCPTKTARPSCAPISGGPAATGRGPNLLRPRRPPPRGDRCRSASTRRPSSHRWSVGRALRTRAVNGSSCNWCSRCGPADGTIVRIGRRWTGRTRPTMGEPPRLRWRPDARPAR
jgi:hypothetical protein